MSPPVAETHPAEVVFAVEALHVVTASVLLNADIALGTVLQKVEHLIPQTKIFIDGDKTLV